MILDFYWWTSEKRTNLNLSCCYWCLPTPFLGELKVYCRKATAGSVCCSPAWPEQELSEVFQTQYSQFAGLVTWFPVCTRSVYCSVTVCLKNCHVGQDMFFGEDKVWLGFASRAGVPGEECNGQHKLHMLVNACVLKAPAWNLTAQTKPI